MEKDKSYKLVIWSLLLVVILLIGLLAYQSRGGIKQVDNYTSPEDLKQAEIESYIAEYVKSQGYGLDYYSADEKRLFALSKNPFINGSFYVNNTNTTN